MDEQLVQRISQACDDVPVIRLTQDLIRMPSPRFEEMKIAEFAGKYMRAFGCDVTMQPVQRQDRVSQQAIGVIKGSGSGPSLMLCGHLDSNVASRPSPKYGLGKDGWHYYRPELWTKPPFDGLIENGWIYGIGAVNMKGGVAAMIAAAEALRKAGIKLRGDLILAAVMGETAGGVGITHLIKSGIRADHAVVTECTNLNVVNISVAACRGAVQFEGRTLHHSPYPNPLEHAARLVVAMGPTFKSAEPGGWLSFAANPELPGFPRAAARSITSQNDFATLEFEIRIVPGMNDDTIRADFERLLQIIRKDCPELKYTIHLPTDSYILNRPAAPGTSLDSSIVRTISAWHQKVTGRKALVGPGVRLGGAADAANLRMAGIPSVEYGPANIEPWPMVDERSRVEDIVAATKVLALAAAELCL